MSKWLVSVPATMTIEVEAETEEQAVQSMVDGASLSDQFDYDKGPWSMEVHWDDPTADAIVEDVP